MAEKLPFDPDGTTDITEIMEEETGAVSVAAPPKSEGEIQETNQRIRETILKGVPSEKAAEPPTAAIAIRPQLDPTVQDLHREALDLLENVKAVTIANPQEARNGSDTLRMIQGLKRALEGKRKDYTSPLDEHKREIMEAFRTLLQPIIEADGIMRGKVLAYEQEQERIRKEQERINQQKEDLARAEMELNGELSQPMGLVEVSPEIPNAIRSETATTARMKRWEYEIVDFSALPDDYKVEAPQIIRAALRQGKTIPGVKAWQEESLSVRGRS